MVWEEVFQVGSSCLDPAYVFDQEREEDMCEGRERERRERGRGRGGKER